MQRCTDCSPRAAARAQPAQKVTPQGCQEGWQALLLSAWPAGHATPPATIPVTSLFQIPRLGEPARCPRACPHQRNDCKQLLAERRTDGLVRCPSRQGRRLPAAHARDGSPRVEERREAAHDRERGLGLAVARQPARVAHFGRYVCELRSREQRGKETAEREKNSRRSRFRSRCALTIGARHSGREERRNASGTKPAWPTLGFFPRTE